MFGKLVLTDEICCAKWAHYHLLLQALGTLVLLDFLEVDSDTTFPTLLKVPALRTLL